MAILRLPILTVFKFSRVLMLTRKNGILDPHMLTPDTNFREPSPASNADQHFLTAAESDLLILSSSSSAPGSTFYPLDPLSDIGGTILELDTVGLAAGKKFNRVMVDECHIPQIQHHVLHRFLQGEQLS